MNYGRRTGDSRASRRNAAFFALLSTRWTLPRRPASSAGDRNTGKPPPEPRSTQILAFGARCQELKRIGDVARPDCRQRGGRDQLMRRCQSSSSATNLSSRASVSRETSACQRHARSCAIRRHADFIEILPRPRPRDMRRPASVSAAGVMPSMRPPGRSCADDVADNFCLRLIRQSGERRRSRDRRGSTKISSRRNAATSAAWRER